MQFFPHSGSLCRLDANPPVCHHGRQDGREVVANDKKTLRIDMLNRRRAIPPDTAAAHSAAIAKRLFALHLFAPPRPVLTYVAAKDNEVDTKPILSRLLKEERPI